MMRDRSLPIVLVLCFLAPPAPAEQTDPDQSVSYARDIAPILQRNCVACHRAGQAEGGLSLENRQAIETGGDSGSLLVAKQPESSLLYVRAGDDDDPMPPEDNTVGAKRLTPAELSLLQTWIAQGAVIDAASAEETIQWQPIDDSIRNSYALAVSPDDRLIAVGHANRVELADAHTGELRGTLVDAGLRQAGVADFDVIQAIAFSPWGDRIATGGFQAVRIWKRQPTTSAIPLALRHAVGPTAISPDRSAVALVNAIGDVEIWQLDSQERRVGINSPGTVADLTWSHPERLVVGYDHGDIGIHDPRTGDLVGQAKLDQAIKSLAQSSESGFIAALGTDGQVRLFDNDQPHPAPSLTSLQDATSMAFFGPGTLVVGTASGLAKTIDVVSGDITRELDHGAAIESIAIAPPSKTLATGGRNGTTKLWNLDDGTLLRTLTGDSESVLRIAALDRHVQREQVWVKTLEGKTDELKKLLEKEQAALAKVTEAREKAAKEFEEKAKQRDDVAKQVAGSEQGIKDAQAMIDASNRAATDAEALIAKSKAEIASLTAELQPLEKQSATALSQVELAQAKADEANRMLAAAKQSAQEIATQVEAKKSQLASVTKRSSEADQTLAKSKAAATEAAKQLESSKAALAKQRESLAAVEKEVQKKQAEVVQRDQALVTATKTRDKAAANIPTHQDSLRMRNNHLADLKHRHVALVERQSHSPAIRSIALGDATVTVVDVDGAVRTYRVADGKPLDRSHIGQRLGGTGPTDAYYLDQNRMIINEHSGPPRMVDRRRQWTLERTIGGVGSDLISDRVTTLDFRGDGQSIAIGSGIPSRQGQVLVVAVATGEVLRRFDDLHSDTVLCARFSPDDRLLATASADKTIRLLDVQTGGVVGALDGHTHHVLSLSWRRDGRLIASGSADGTIKTWDAETGQQKRTIGGFPDEVTAVEFLGDSTRVASSCADGQVRVHETNNGGSVAAASAPGDFLFTLGTGTDGARVFASGQNGDVHVWQTEGLKAVGKW
ncbi:c-type cytochrome domain-containing protein [Rhodopirellula sp. JC639]|uniref:WD40 domain-containing protein n=1 Tax=Stieleria mannarensis TaxID=2755585 RepID=UPI001603CCE7|nr:c-type cytochrome domain-containing protein [Rhodopirellula sp. JC639]